MLFTFYCSSLVFVSVYFCLHHWTATKDSRFLSRCSSAQARVKTLATVLATPLSLFIVSFSFRTVLSAVVFGRRKPRFFLPQPWPDRVFQALTRDQPAAVSILSYAPTAFFPPTVAIRPRLFITQARSDRRCQSKTRDLDRVCFLQTRDLRATVAFKPAVRSRESAPYPRSANYFLSLFLRLNPATFPPFSCTCTATCSTCIPTAISVPCLQNCLKYFSIIYFRKICMINFFFF